MKKVVFALIAVVASGAVVNATTVAVSTTNGVTKTQEEKVKIKAEELPEEVKTALKGEEYKDWEISQAYKYTTTEHYEVELKNAAETKTVKFDKDGNVID